jgi:hypothetical protein
VSQPRTVYDEVREDPLKQRHDAAPVEMGAERWRRGRDAFEQYVVDERLSAEPSVARERAHLVRIAALAIAQIEALDRRTAEAKA